KRRLFYSVGTTELLRQPEFKKVEKVKPVLSLLEEKQELGHILQDNSNKPIKIKIGSENQMEALSDMSLIQTDFSQDNNQLGTLAILGPTRMEYSRIINMLSYMKHLMETMARNQT
ncbi:MAG: HrcA family transcriptional regulator, partial [Veillonella sp.]|nr:HrcA family transcriptional regulator [Veillonella sp.]